MGLFPGMTDFVFVICQATAIQIIILGAVISLKVFGVAVLSHDKLLS